MIILAIWRNPSKICLFTWKSILIPTFLWGFLSKFYLQNSSRDFAQSSSLNSSRVFYLKVSRSFLSGFLQEFLPIFYSIFFPICSQSSFRDWYFTLSESFFELFFSRLLSVPGISTRVPLKMSVECRPFSRNLPQRVVRDFFLGLSRYFS